MLCELCGGRARRGRVLARGEVRSACAVTKRGAPRSRLGEGLGALGLGPRPGHNRVREGEFVKGQGQDLRAESCPGVRSGRSRTPGLGGVAAGPQTFASRSPDLQGQLLLRKGHLLGSDRTRVMRPFRRASGSRVLGGDCQHVDWGEFQRKSCVFKPAQDSGGQASCVLSKVSRQPGSQRKAPPPVSRACRWAVSSRKLSFYFAFVSHIEGDEANSCFKKSGKVLEAKEELFTGEKSLPDGELLVSDSPPVVARFHLLEVQSPHVSESAVSVPYRPSTRRCWEHYTR